MLNLPINKKLAILLISVLMIGGILALAPLWGTLFLPEDAAYATVPITGVAVALPAFAALCLAIRCRGCGYRLFWHAVRKRTYNNSIEWFLTANECPQCGKSNAHRTPFEF
jgi:hypothetical protein